MTVAELLEAISTLLPTMKVKLEYDSGESNELANIESVYIYEDELILSYLKEGQP